VKEYGSQGTDIFFQFHTVTMLNTVWRQRDDPEFVRLLQGLRDGEVSEKDQLIWNSRVLGQPNVFIPPGLANLTVGAISNVALYHINNDTPLAS
jgi:hypothetical protein